MGRSRFTGPPDCCSDPCLALGETLAVVFSGVSFCACHWENGVYTTLTGTINGAFTLTKSGAWDYVGAGAVMGANYSDAGCSDEVESGAVDLHIEVGCSGGTLGLAMWLVGEDGDRSYIFRGSGNLREAMPNSLASDAVCPTVDAPLEPDGAVGYGGTGTVEI